VRGELDREREPIELPHELGRLRRGAPFGQHLPDATLEQRDAGRSIEPDHLNHPLAREPEPRHRGHEHPPLERDREVGREAPHSFDAVEHHEVEALGHRGRHRREAELLHREGATHRRHRSRFGLHVLELDHRRAPPTRDRRCERGLPRAGGPYEGRDAQRKIALDALDELVAAEEIVHAAILAPSDGGGDHSMRVDIF
jgi:hypothetical protein